MSVLGPPERMTLYWCDGSLGIHVDTHAGEWNGARLKPFGVVRADVAALEAQRVLDVAVIGAMNALREAGVGQDVRVHVREAMLMRADLGAPAEPEAEPKSPAADVNAARFIRFASPLLDARDRLWDALNEANPIAGPAGGSAKSAIVAAIEALARLLAREEIAKAREQP